MQTLDLIYPKNGQDYVVRITKKKMRRIIFHVRKGEILISAPYLASRKLILDNLEHIFPRLEPMLKREAAISLDSIYLLGEKRPLVQDGHFSVSDVGVTFKSPDDLDRKLRKFALDFITSRVRYYEMAMNVPKAYKVRVRKMESRYGSNSRGSHTLTFAFKLIHYSPAIIDSIVVHELAHFFNFDHSHQFYETVMKYY
ncbi:MAG: M48 family metallopeptidase, partial [Firmicutes bacterium]|nr:M48 family metallopeptidase [Bacillota bacterium]